MRRARSRASRTLGSSSTTRIRTQAILRLEAEKCVRGLVRVEREPARVAGLGAVPVADGGLVDLPAQVDLATVAQGGKVDQAGLEIADQQIELLEVLEPERRGDGGLGAHGAGIGAAEHIGERCEA